MSLSPSCWRWLSTATRTTIRNHAALQPTSGTPSSPFLKCVCRNALRSSSKPEYNSTTRTSVFQSPRRTFTTSKTLSSSSPFRLISSSHENSPDYSSLPETAEEAAEKQHVYYSPYKPKRQWPPDMSKLSHKHQFRLERKFRRRAALKYARPKWVKATKLVQWGLIGCKFYRSVLFM